MQQRFQRRSFAPHTQKKSTAAYASLELKLIWTLLQASRLPENERSISTFDADQLAALQNLWIIIGKTQYNARQATGALESVFQTVYYPQTPNTIRIDVQVLAGTRGGGRTPTYLTTDGAPLSDVPSVRINS